MYKINQIIKKIFSTVGLDVSLYSKPSPHPLVHHKIELLLDVGANTGQHARKVREKGYKNKIISFEPLPEAYEILLKNSKKDPLWTVYEKCALGSNLGETDINISKNSYSSSIKPMLEAHLSSAPESIYIGKTKTNIFTLDSIFDSFRLNNDKTYLKIDTQGFEKEVLDGATLSLKNIFAVQLELSIQPLYDGQELYKYFFSFFEKSGFSLWSLEPVFEDKKTGKLLQFDAIFVKNE